MEVVRSACPIYRFTMIPASRVALVSSIQVNDRGKAGPAVPYRCSDLVRWPTAAPYRGSASEALQTPPADAGVASQHHWLIQAFKPRTAREQPGRSSPAPESLFALITLRFGRNDFFPVWSALVCFASWSRNNGDPPAR